MAARRDHRDVDGVRDGVDGPRFALSRCAWLERNAEGRPRCEHGWAHKAGVAWRCPLKAYENNHRYHHTEKGRETRRRENASDHARSRKELYELTRIRVS